MGGKLAKRVMRMPPHERRRLFHEKTGPTFATRDWKLSGLGNVRSFEAFAYTMAREKLTESIGQGQWKWLKDPDETASPQPKDATRQRSSGKRMQRLLSEQVALEQKRVDLMNRIAESKKGARAEALASIKENFALLDDDGKRAWSDSLTPTDLLAMGLTRLTS